MPQLVSWSRQSGPQEHGTKRHAKSAAERVQAAACCWEEKQARSIRTTLGKSQHEDR